MNPLEKYRALLTSCEQRIAGYKKRARQLAFLRTMVFLAGAALVYIFWQSPEYAWPSILVSAILFLALVRRHATAKERLTEEQAYRHVCSDAIEIVNGRWRTRSEGIEYLADGHPFAADLNVFGRHSLFQFLNRTQTQGAKDLLAGWLQVNLTDPERILDERGNIGFLAADTDWSLRFLAHARQIKDGDIEKISRWTGEPEFDKSPAVWFALTRALPVLMVGVVVAYAVGIIGWNAFLLSLLVPGIITMGALRAHSARFGKFLAVLGDVSANEAMIEMIRQRDFKGVRFADKIADANLDNSTRAIADLRKIVGAIESRNNIFVSIALNLILLWDFQCARRLARWKKANGASVAGWLALCRETEAYLSLSAFVHDHPDHVYPEFDVAGTLKVNQLSHPLMDYKAVSNSLDLSDPIRFSIITGANMAGKSTWLRAVGLNMVLAMRGLPIPASSMTFTPVRIYTSMLAADSLGENESYFFSELKRLRYMIDALESGEPHFVILDEILKGTNSIDKAEGSRKFMEKLLSLPAKGLIATHDLSLCNLSETRPTEILNQRFEVTFEGDELAFDYKLKAGVCENMNASFLLKKMGLVND